MLVKITEEQGELLKELEYSDGFEEIDGNKYYFQDIECEVEDHRWNTTDRYVFRRNDGKLFGMLYDFGKTEMQENGFVYNTPALKEVVKKKITVVKEWYEEVK